LTKAAGPLKERRGLKEQQVRQGQLLLVSILEVFESTSIAKISFI
jgi:hypothetical protein